MKSLRTPLLRRKLASHVVVLTILCALPLGGLAVYFLSVGLHREIAVAEKERSGLSHVRQTISVLQHVVRLAWTEQDDAHLIAELEEALKALESNDVTLQVNLQRYPVPFPAAPVQPPLPSAKELWQQAKSTVHGSADRKESLRRLVSQLHQGIFQSSDRSGLSSGPENEISALTDVVAVCLPLHVERLLHMHERIMGDLKTGNWDGPGRTAAAIFVREIEEEDLRRLTQSFSAALIADANSAHTLHSFQRDFPAQGQAMLAGLRKLTTVIDPLAQSDSSAVTPADFDRALRDAFESALTGWTASINQLDALVSDQIDEARARRNSALGFAGLITALLLPIAWLYYGRGIRPVISAMVDEAVELKQAALTARAEADESTLRLRQTQAALEGHSAVTVLNLDRTIVAVNDRTCQLAGFPLEELVGQPFTSTAPLDLSPMVPEMLLATAQHQVWHGTLKHQHKNGEIFWTDATAFPFLNADGQVTESVVIETDITELVKAREKAESAALAKSRFLAMMSHEIRTPMNGVIGFAQLLAESPLNDQQRDYLKTILTSGESLLVVINDILDYSKLEAGRAELDLRAVALRTLIEDTLGLLTAQARAKGLELVYWIDPAIPEGILADGPRLRQVLLNLAGNAVKFTPQGHVEITVRPATESDNKSVTFRIRDTGIGIAPERMDRLFKAFSQVDTSITRNFGGTGLGLAISQRLVSLMGGEIGVISNLGQGSEFHFTLPITPAAITDDAGSRNSIAPFDPGVLRRKRILVVDDLEPNRRLLDLILTRHGATVVSVSSVRDAHTELLGAPFDLVLLDYMMPETSGLTLARELRASTRYRTLPLVLLTSVQPELMENAAQVVDAMLVKPVRSQPLLALVVRIITDRHMETAAVNEPSTSASFAQSNPLRVAVVDDNPINLKVIEAMLRVYGYEPKIFYSAKDLLALLSREKIDVIFMDVQMPGMDGFEATRRIRAGDCGENSRSIHIIALTAGAMPEERAACLAAGMDDFMAKPISRPELLTRLSGAAAAVAKSR